MRLKYLLLLIVFTIPFTGFAEVKSMAGLPYHPDEANSEASLFNQGNTAFAIDSIKDNHLFFKGGYIYQKSWIKNQPEIHTGTNQYLNFSDIRDPYQGVFYKINENNLVSANLSYMKNTYGSSDGKSSNKSQAELAGKLLVSGKYEGIYYGGFFLAQSVSLNDFRGTEFTIDVSNDAKSSMNKTLTNYYYHLALGYELNPKFKMGLTFDNIMNLSAERDQYNLTFEEETSEILLPFMLLEQFKTPLYRFNTIGNDTLGYLSEGVDSGSKYFFMEKIKNISIQHFNYHASYQFNLLQLFFKLKYLKSTYASDLDIFYATPAINSYKVEKNGSYNALSYHFTLIPKPLQPSPNNQWFSQLNFSGILFSNLSEKAASISTPGYEANYKVNFSQQRIGFTLGNKKNNREAWIFFNFSNNSAYYSFYYCDLQFSGTFPSIYNYLYPQASTGMQNPVQNTKKTWKIFYGGLANRYTYKKFIFDAGLSFHYIKLPTDSKYHEIKATLGAVYKLTEKSNLYAQYNYNYALTYEISKNEPVSFGSSPQKMGFRAYTQALELGYKYLF